MCLQTVIFLWHPWRMCKGTAVRQVPSVLDAALLAAPQLSSCTWNGIRSLMHVLLGACAQNMLCASVCFKSSAPCMRAESAPTNLDDCKVYELSCLAVLQK